MIFVTFQKDASKIDIEFPCSDSDLNNKLSLLKAVPDGVTPVPLKIIEVYEPKELDMLTGAVVKPDELNYLAKRMTFFMPSELRQFFAATAQEKNADLKTLINLTFNLDHYTIIQDISSFEAIGKTYTLNTCGCIPADFAPDFGVIGQMLMESNSGIPTRYGLLFVSEDPIQEIYDGQVFPPYYDGNPLISLSLSYHGKTEVVYLPTDDVAITKAVHRLGTCDPKDCELVVEDFNTVNTIWLDRIADTAHLEGLYAANHLASAINKPYMDWDLLDAMIEVSGIDNAEGIVGLVENMQKFNFIPSIKTEEQLGEYFVEHEDDYHLNIDMWPYFDFGSFGEYIKEQKDGVFACGGFLHVDDFTDMAEVFAEIKGEDQGHGIQMGGL